MDIRAVDTALAQLADGSRECGPILDRLRTLLPPSDEPTTPREVFSSTIAGDEGDIVLATGLRLILEASACLDQHPEWRVAIWAFMDRFAADIYQASGVTEKLQTFEKEPRLRHALAEVSQDFDRILGRLSHIDRIPDVRTRVMNWLNKNPAKGLVRPFLTDRLAVADLAEVCDDIEAYRTSDGPTAVRAYDRAGASLADWASDIESVGTGYARTYLGRLALRMREVVEASFEASALGKPAVLRVDAAPKKYPLHEDSRAIRVGIVIRNAGGGPAEDVRILTTDSTGNVVPDNAELYLGRIEEPTVDVQIQCHIVSPDDYAILSGTVEWRNYDGSPASSNFDVGLTAQRRDVDWDQLRLEDPYSLEPVESEEELSGRSEQLAQLTALATRRQLGSLILFGQKRVGKTSIARTLAARLGKSMSSDDHVIYVESGDYVDRDAARTVTNLGLRLCEELRGADDRLTELPVPEFDGALKPLGDFLRTVHERVPTLRALLILDEFDELPIELYRRGPLGDALFLTLRTQSGKPNIGFCLIGGEKMEHVLAAQGDALNKFKPVRVDYFDRAGHWSDFTDLVRKPVSRWLEISDDALAEMYSETAGNPFFTKLIAGDLYRMMVERRDAHVTASEVREAAEAAIQGAASNSFQHFWEDGIVDVGGRVELVSLRRRRLLISMARLARQGTPRTRQAILQESERLGVAPADGAAELDEFCRRQVLEFTGGEYACKVPFFERWLVERGISELITQALDPEAVQAHQRDDDASYVRSGELVELVAGWALYRGARVGEDRVRAWLEQFEGPRERRLMYRLLTGLSFYGADRIRAKLAEAHGIVRRGLEYSVASDRRKRGEIVVSYLDQAGKSGSAYARLYASENHIYADNVVDRAGVQSALADPATQALVFVDDFIGTGTSAAGAVSEIADGLRSARSVSTYIVAICGFQAGQKVVEQAIRKANVAIHVRVCDLLDDSDRAFSDVSRLFPDEEDLLAARDVAYRYGRQLVKASPLGYGDVQSLVVFDQSIPNNDPPILWQHSSTWEPLFRRL